MKSVAPLLMAATFAGCATPVRDDNLAELARAEHAGLITSIDQASRYQNISPDDVSHLYTENAAVFKSPEIMSLISATSQADIDRLAPAAEKKVKQLEEIGRSTDFAPKRDWTQGLSMTMPEYPNVRVLEKAYCYLAQYYVRKGDSGIGLRYLSYAANIVKQSSSQKLLIDKLVFAAVNSIWTRSAIVCARKLWDDSAELNGILALTARFPEPNYKEALGYELAAFRQSFKPVVEGRTKLAEFMKARWAVGENADVAAAAAQLDPAKIERLAIGEYALAAEKWHSREELEATLKKTHSSTLTEEDIVSLITPVFLSAKDSELRQLAEQHCFRIAIAARLIKLETGKWPNLAAAAKRAQTVPVDPFSKDTIRFKTDNNGVAAYSMGPDGVDNGGFEMRTSVHESNYDVAVTRLP